MKKLLLVLVLAAACFALLATPALASAPWAPEFRLQPDTAYLFAYMDGSWFEVNAEGEFLGYWATYDDEGNFVAPADPIPADYDIVLQESWKGWTFGLMKQLPTAFEIQLSITQGDVSIVDISYEQAKQYWTGPFLWDEYWVNALGTFPAFNLHVGTEIYANRWLPPLTGDDGLATNLTAAKKLPPGAYTVDYSERWVKSWTNMDQFYDDFGLPVSKSPWHAKPGDGGSTSFTFTVQ